MANDLAKHRSPFADIAPALATYTDDVLFGDVWKLLACRRAIAAWSPSQH